MKDNEKLCLSCGYVKDKSEFYKAGNSTPDGLQRKCKDCYLKKEQK